MGDKTGIEWTDATWNPVVGCSITSPGCTNCYAMKQAQRIQRMAPIGHISHYTGLTMPTKAGAVWTGRVARSSAQMETAPLRWKRPRRVFVNSMGDLFHERVPDEWIDRVFAVMALSPQHTFQVLTKRPERMRAYLTDMSGARADGRGTAVVDLARKHHPDPDALCLEGFRWPLPNVWLGVSAEDQARADERIPLLLDTPAAKRFVSAEPLLGPVDLTNVCDGAAFYNALGGTRWHDAPGGAYEKFGRLDWVIVGGESGPGARPMHPDWARALRDQCQAAGAPFFFKQWGEWAPVPRAEDRPARPQMVRAGDRMVWSDDHAVLGRSLAYAMEGVGEAMRRSGKKAAGALLDGVEHKAFPA